jgi:hypothetical protein
MIAGEDVEDGHGESADTDSEHDEIEHGDGRLRKCGAVREGA